jgi:hypothetical protein
MGARTQLCPEREGVFRASSWLSARDWFDSLWVPTGFRRALGCGNVAAGGDWPPRPAALARVVRPPPWTQEVATPYTSAEFTALTETVASDIVEASLHFQLFRSLVNAVPQFERELNQSPAFWTLTFTAHRDAWVLRLCRAYDQEQRALSLKRWLALIGEHLPLFDEPHFRERQKDNPFVASLAARPRKPDPQQLEMDQASVDGRDALVKRVVFLRNNVFAHTSVQRALDINAIWQNAPLSFEDAKGLLDRGIQIVNRYSNLFQAKTYSPAMVGADDYGSLLKAVGREIEHHEAQFQNEFEKLTGAHR